MKQLMHEADEYVLGRVDSSQLPMIAAHALARGMESPALCELAGLSHNDVREAADLFPVAMAELGHPLRDPQTVLWDRAARTAQALLDASRDVGDAIDEIAWLLCKAGHKLPDGRHNELATDFELLRVDWEESQDRRHSTEIAAGQACRRLLETVITLGVNDVCSMKESAQ